MKKVTINRRDSASMEEPVAKLTPLPGPPPEWYMHKIMMNVFGRRFELTSRVEVRRITKDPTIVIEMPRRRAIEQ